MKTRNRNYTVCGVLGLMIALGGCQSTQPVAGNEGHPCIVLVGHGSPPADFPEVKLGRYFRLEGMVHDYGDAHNPDGTLDLEHIFPDADMRKEYVTLRDELLNWPRTVENDPYKFGVEEVAKQLSVQAGQKVFVAFNESCAPTVESVLTSAAEQGYRNIVVMTTMMVPGGGHSEKDIPRKIDQMQLAYPEIRIVYAWPYKVDQLAQSLAAHARQFQ